MSDCKLEKKDASDTNNKSAKHKYLPQVLLIVSSALWGCSFIFTKGLFLNEPSITPTIIITARMLIASVFAIPILLVSGKMERIKKGHMKMFLLLAFTEPFLYSLCETSGIKFVSGSLAAIIIATIPLFIPFAMSLLYKERLLPKSIIGTSLSLIGIAVMSLGDTLSFDANPLGLLLLAGAVFIAVVYTVTLVKILPHYRPITITTYQNLIALFYFLPLMLIFDHDKLSGLSFGLQMWIYLAVLGILCSTVAYACFNYGMRALGATAGSVYNNIIPIFSLLFALALGQESLSWIKVAGMTIVLIGLTIAQRKPKE